MNLARALRPAQNILTTALVTVVIATGVTAAAPSTATAATPVAVAPVAVAPVAVAPVAVARAAVPVGTVRAASTAYSATYEHAVKYWVNSERRDHGLEPLSRADCTDTVAESWSAYLAASNRFYHQSMTKLLYRCDAYYAGETLGRGSITPRTLVDMWMQSPPHRHVLLSSNSRRIGIGATPDANGQWVVAANFMRF